MTNNSIKLFDSREQLTNEKSKVWWFAFPGTRLQELSDKFHSSKSSGESKSVTGSSGFGFKSEDNGIVVRKEAYESNSYSLLTAVGKRVNNLAKEQWFDCTIRWSIVEKPINFSLPPPPTFSFSPLRQTRGGVRGKLHIIHRETSLRRPFPTGRDRGMNALERGKSVDGRTSDESRLTTTPRYFFNFSRIPSAPLFRFETRPSEI